MESYWSNTYEIVSSWFMTKYTRYHFVSAYFVRNELREDEKKKSIHESFGR